MKCESITLLHLPLRTAEAERRLTNSQLQFYTRARSPSRPRQQIGQAGELISLAHELVQIKTRESESRPVLYPPMIRYAYVYYLLAAGTPRKVK